MSLKPYQICTDGSASSGGQTFSSPYPDGTAPAGYGEPCPCSEAAATVTVSCACPEDGNRAVGGDLAVAGNLTVGGRIYGGAIADWIGPGQAGLATAAQVYLYIDGLRLPDRYAAKGHRHPLSEIYWGGNEPYEAGTSIGAESTDGELATAKAVYDFVAAAVPVPTGSIAPTSGGSGPQPTGSEDEIPTVGAVVEYVEETVASAVADGIAAAREIYTFTADGSQKSFPIQHTLAEKEVTADVLDSNGAKVLVRIVFQSVGNLLVMFAEPPAPETYTIILTK